MSTRRALAYSFLDRYAGLAVYTVSSMIIARLLTPAEIGVYSVVMVLVGFVATFRDLGAGQYLVRHQSLTVGAMRATFTVQLSLGIFFAALVLLISAAVAQFYREPRMRGILMVLSLNFVVTPWLAYPNAWLLREMRFANLAVVRFVGGLAGAGTAIGMVLAGFGPISLAWGNLANTMFSMATIHVVGRPRLPRRPTVQGLGDVLSFGGQLTIISLLDTLRLGAAELCLGRLQSMTLAGHLSRAQGLVAMFEQLVFNAVNQVAFPFFSKEVRENRAVGPPFLKAMGMVTGLGWPFFGGLLLLAYPAIRLLYGTQWDAAVEPVRWLAAGAALGLLGMVCHSPLLAIGAVREAVYASLTAAVLTVAAALVGAGQGLLETVKLLAAAAVLSSGYWLWLAHRRLGFTWAAAGTTAIRSAALTMAAMVAPAASVAFFGWRPSSAVLPLALGVPGGVLGFLLAASLMRHDLWLEVERAVPLLRRISKSPAVTPP